MLEGEVANDVGVEDEERRVVLSEDLLGELERTSGAKGLSLDGKGDVDVERLLVLGNGQIDAFYRYCVPPTFFNAAVIISGR